MDIDTLCPCCNDRNFNEFGNSEICPVCGWIDDPVQRKNPEINGKNEFSLSVSKLKWETRKSVAVANMYRSN